MKINPLRTMYGNDSRWVNWKMETVGGRPTKVPYSFKGGKASSTNPDTWGTLDECMKVSKQCGLVCIPSRTSLFIDIDHCLNEAGEIEHADKEKIERLVQQANTYVEISPSKTGLHLYFALEEPIVLSANRSGNFEAYTSGRYFTVTGKSFGESKDVRTIDEMEAISQSSATLGEKKSQKMWFLMGKHKMMMYDSKELQELERTLPYLNMRFNPKTERK